MAIDLSSIKIVSEVVRSAQFSWKTRRMKLMVWCFFSILLAGESLWAFKLSGTIYEKGTRKPMSGINVFLLPQKLKAVTDSSGRFEWAEVTTEGERGEIVINASGYKKFVQAIEWSQQTSVEGLKFYVERESYQYQETTVTGLREKSAAQKSLKQEEFLQMPGSGGDPVKAVQNLPGVSRSTGGDARVIIQGSEPEDTRYHLEGHEVPLIFHFGGVTSLITPEAVGSVDYFSSGYGAEWGRALGGHVGLNTRLPKTDRWHSMAFIDAFSSGFLIEGPLSDKSSFLATGRVSYLGAVLKAVTKDNKDFNFVVAPSYYDLHAQYEQKLNEQDQFRLQSIISNDELEFVLAKPVGNDPRLRGNFYQQTRFYRLMPSWERKIDERRSVKVALAFGANDITFDLAANYFRLRNNALTTLGEWRQVMNESWKTTLGFDNLYDWFNVSLRLPSVYNEGGISNPLSSGEVKESAVSGKQSVIGVYWSNEWKPFIGNDSSTPWTLFPQLRFDRFGPTKEQLLQPRFSLRYKISPHSQWRFNSGLYHQLPRPQENDAYYGNPDLKSLRAVHASLGWERDFREGGSVGWRSSAALFYKRLDRLVLSSNNKVQRDGVEVNENFNNRGEGRIHGVETQFRYDLEQWAWVLNYTWLQSRRWSPGQAELPSPFDQTHSVNLLMSYKHDAWRYGARFRYVTGNPYTPITGSFFDADNDVYIPVRGAIFSERNQNFMQLDVRVDRQWVYDTWILSAYFDVQNLTNAKNQEGLTYAYDYSEKQVISGIPVLPTIGVKGEF